jgi:glycosyltransferase involved in cell wall biosynthesis
MIPTYNPNLNYLRQALSSILEQAPGSDQMQIELIDDGSTEFDPQSFLYKIAGSRVTFYRQPRHAGIGGNWNTCLERARGHWVHLLHQDDLVLSGFYRRLRQIIEKKTDIGAVFCHHFFIDTDGHRVFERSRIKAKTGDILTDWLEHVFVFLSIQTPSIVVKRSVYEHLGGFDVSFGYALDWDMWKRIAAQYPVWFEPEPLAGRRGHGESTTRKLMRSGMNIAEIFRSIEISKSYLPAAIATDMAWRARDKYTKFAVRTAVRQLFKRDAGAALAQVREVLKTRSGMAVMKAFMMLALETLGARRI